LTPEREPEKRLPVLRNAAGTKIAQCAKREAVTRNNGPAVSKSIAGLGMSVNQKFRPSINWRASLVPASAVIPAPIVYTNIAAVKKLVVTIETRPGQWPRLEGLSSSCRACKRVRSDSWVGPWYFERFKHWPIGRDLIDEVTNQVLIFCKDPWASKLP
jgi:hypothetical protein